MTAHWIEREAGTNNLSLRAALLAFHRLRGSHTGKSMARTAMHLLDRAGITGQVGHFTLDNATNNGMFMEELKHLFHVREVPFCHLDNRIMCFAHIINICCQHVIKDFTNVELIEIAEEFIAAAPSEYPDRQTFEEAVKRDPIALGRNIVRILRSSGQRRDAFAALILEGNTRNWFSAGSPPVVGVQVNQLQLLRDVRTRWDSVYAMIRRLRELRPVCH